MKLNELKPSEGSKKTRKRVGRGNGSGWGKTAGKGSNGQKSRSGSYIHAGFEGGQMPLIKRVPKRGFSNAVFKNEYSIVNLDTLEKMFEDGAVITPEALYERGLINHIKLIRTPNSDDKIRETILRVKVLAKGELSKKFTIKAHKISESAKEKVENAGGSVEVIEVKTFAEVAKEKGQQ